MRHGTRAQDTSLELRPRFVRRLMLWTMLPYVVRIRGDYKPFEEVAVDLCPALSRAQQYASGTRGRTCSFQQWSNRV